MRQGVHEGVIGEPDFRQLLAVAVTGDPRAVAMFRHRARAVGVASAMPLDPFDPEVIVVVEAGAMRLPGCLGALRDEVCRRSPTAQTPAVTTTFGRDVLPVAAGAVALAGHGIDRHVQRGELQFHQQGGPYRWATWEPKVHGH